MMLSYALFSFSVMYLQKQKITKNFIIDIFIHMLIGDSHMVDLYYILLEIDLNTVFPWIVSAETILFWI